MDETLALAPVVRALRFAAALGLGVLLGLERERAKKAETSFASSGVAARSIVIAVASNTLFKAGMVAFLGAASLRRSIVGAAAAMFAAAAATAILL